MKKLILGALVTLLSASAMAANTSLSYLYGEDFKTGDAERNTLRVESMAKNDYGLLFGRVDVGSFDQNSTVNTRVLGHLDIYKGWHLAGQLQNTAGVNVKTYGLGYSEFKKDGYWGVDFGLVDSNFYDGGYQTFAYFKQPIWGPFKLEGFVEYYSPNSGHNTLLAQPSVMLEYKQFAVGVEQQIYINKFGVKNLDESLYQLKAKYTF